MPTSMSCCCTSVLCVHSQAHYCLRVSLLMCPFCTAHAHSFHEAIDIQCSKWAKVKVRVVLPLSGALGLRARWDCFLCTAPLEIICIWSLSQWRRTHMHSTSKCVAHVLVMSSWSFTCLTTLYTWAHIRPTLAGTRTLNIAAIDLHCLVLLSAN